MKNWINSEINDCSTVLNTRVQLMRNFNSIPFPNKIDKIEARKNSKLVYEELLKVIGTDISLYKLWEKEKQIYEEYVEKGLIDKKLLKEIDKGAFIADDSETFSVIFNDEEHIKINCITAGLNLEEALSKANEIDNYIENKFEYAFDERLGYLMAEPKNLGTGLNAKITLYLPTLTINDQISKVSKFLGRLGMKIKHLYSFDLVEYGYVYEISNNVSPSLKEQDIIGNLKGTILNIISEEKKAKEILMSKQKNAVEDKVYRAYAILKSAILMDFKECIELIAYVRLGVELGLIDISGYVLNHLTISLSDSYIRNIIGKELTMEELRFERASIIKKILK